MNKANNQIKRDLRSSSSIKILYAIDERRVYVSDNIKVLYVERVSDREDIMDPLNYEVKVAYVSHFKIPMEFDWDDAEQILRTAIKDKQNK